LDGLNGFIFNTQRRNAESQNRQENTYHRDTETQRTALLSNKQQAEKTGGGRQKTGRPKTEENTYHRDTEATEKRHFWATSNKPRRQEAEGRR